MGKVLAGAVEGEASVRKRGLSLDVGLVRDGTQVPHDDPTIITA
jgi:hypothetical protein